MIEMFKIDDGDYRIVLGKDRLSTGSFFCLIVQEKVIKKKFFGLIGNIWYRYLDWSFTLVCYYEDYEKDPQAAIMKAHALVKKLLDKRKERMNSEEYVKKNIDRLWFASKIGNM